MIRPAVTGSQPPAPPTRAGRYSTEKAAQEIFRVLEGLPRGTKSRIAEAVGWGEVQQLSKRLSGTYKLRIEQIGIIADILGAPTGWPFIPWVEAEERDEAYRKRNRRKSPE